MMEAPRHPGGKWSLRLGLGAILLSFGGFGTWAALAPLDSAAIALGEVKVQTYRKTIQHLEGGIVGQIHVREGQRVSKGQTLITLDATRLKARHRQLRSQYLDALARRDRLLAERDDRQDISFSNDLTRLRVPEIDDVMAAHLKMFHARRTLLNGQISVLSKQSDQFRQEIEALVSERQAKLNQLVLIDKEVAMVADLVERGLAVRSRLFSLQREQAKLNGEEKDFGAQIARVRQSIGETDLKMVDLQNKYYNEVVSDLAKTETDIRDVTQDVIAVEDSLRHTIIIAPQNGVVVGLKIHTTGGVIRSGDPLMDLVPEQDVLMVEAKLKPNDIDVVEVGQAAQVRLKSYNLRYLPPASGTVTMIAPDLLEDGRSGDKYYLAQILLDPPITPLPAPLQPGMQADVLIRTGERTVLEYLFEPVKESLSKAGRED